MTETETKFYNLSDIAKAAGVSATSASTYVIKHGLNYAKTGAHGAHLYTDEVRQRVISHYRNKRRETVTPTARQISKDDMIAQLQKQLDDCHDTIELLKKQLSVKDSQIKAQNQQISDAHQLLDQAQQLDLASHKQLTVLEHGSPQNDAKPETETDNNKNEHGFWWKLTH